MRSIGRLPEDRVSMSQNQYCEESDCPKFTHKSRMLTRARAASTIYMPSLRNISQSSSVQTIHAFSPFGRDREWGQECLRWRKRLVAVIFDPKATELILRQVQEDRLRDGIEVGFLRASRARTTSCPGQRGCPAASLYRVNQKLALKPPITLWDKLLLPLTSAK